MTRDEVFALFASRQVHWRNRDPAGLAASHTEDGVVVSPIFGTVKGRAAIESSYRRLFTAFEDWTLEPEQALVDNDRAAQPFSVTATHSHEIFGLEATGRRLEIRGVLMFEFGDGKIQRERRYYDFTGMLMQIGVLKAKPG